MGEGGGLWTPVRQTRGWTDGGFDATRRDVSGPTNNWPTAKLYARIYALFWFDVARREWNVANPESTPEHYCYDRVIPCHRCPPNAPRKWYTPVDDASNQPYSRRNFIGDEMGPGDGKQFLIDRVRGIIIYQLFTRESETRVWQVWLFFLKLKLFQVGEGKKLKSVGELFITRVPRRWKQRKTCRR